jgi:hypothetical protein
LTVLDVLIAIDARGGVRSIRKALEEIQTKHADKTTERQKSRVYDILVSTISSDRLESMTDSFWRMQRKKAGITPCSRLSRIPKINVN